LQSQSSKEPHHFGLTAAPGLTYTICWSHPNPDVQTQKMVYCERVDNISVNIFIVSNQIEIVANIDATII
jgi:hypothetical protein